MFGFYNICKPPGPTSHDLVARMRKRLPRKTRVGHAGTLDPFASGVLLLAAGSATRLIEYLHQADKTYRTTIQLHASSSTDDATGEIQPVEDPPAIDHRQLCKALEDFRGTIRQIPPAHSAAKINGRRAYSLARSGLDVKLAARSVTIHRIDLLSFDSDAVKLEITCATGTYIRALARDLGRALATAAHCKELSRTRIGAFEISQAKSVEQIDLEADLIDPLCALEGMARLAVSDAQARDLLQGKRIQHEQTPPQGPVALTHEERLLAIASLCDQTGLLQPAKVFHPI